ncbi:hypothetical protein [Streptomyces sp. CA-253872]|uniref:hypothetical protein n=1 Tax=Streptomyces sp. CA-253872 TaxID=3240067 RepID=UPI003D8A6869
MACSCQSKNKNFEVLPKAGTATRPAFTSASQPTAEAVANRYATSIVRDKTTGEAVYFAWPDGTYEVALDGGDGAVVVASTSVRKPADRRTLREAADRHATAGAVVRAAGGGTVVYPLPAALTASGVPVKTATK